MAPGPDPGAQSLLLLLLLLLPFPVAVGVVVAYGEEMRSVEKPSGVMVTAAEGPGWDWGGRRADRELVRGPGPQESRRAGEAHAYSS